MITKTKRITAIVITVITSLMLIAGAVLKVIGVQKIVDDFNKLGVGQYTRTLGVFELIFISLFLYPKTMKLGFLLLTSYLGGAIAVHISHNEMSLQPAIPLTLLWIGAYLRDRSILVPWPEWIITENVSA